MTPALQGRAPGQVGIGTEGTQLDSSPHHSPSSISHAGAWEWQERPNKGTPAQGGREEQENRRQHRPHSQGAGAATCS